MESTSTYMDLFGGTHRFFTRVVVYKLNKEKGMGCCVGATFSVGWYQMDAENE